MPNKETANDTTALKTEETNQTEKDKPYILLALIEHGSRPIAYVILGLFLIIFLFQIKEPFLDLLQNTEEVKYGSFAMRLRASADLDNLGKELNDLQSFDDAQIQLFLIVGNKNRPHITYRGPEVTEENLNRLKEAGLLSDVRREADGNLSWVVSNKGQDLHELIFKHVVKAIRRNPTT